jgi:hypothetical protein
VQVTRPQDGVKLAVRAGDKVVWQKQLELAPESPFTVDLPAGARAGDLSVSLTDSSGQVLARWLRPARKPPERPVKGYLKIEPTRPGRRAEEQWLNGRDFEKLGDFDPAAKCYAQALKTEPGFSPAQIGLGVLALRQGLCEPAREHFQNVLIDDPANEAARFYLAACHLAEESFAEAMEKLKAVMRSRPFRAGAGALLGGLCLGQGDLPKAVEQLEKCAAQFPWNQEATALLARDPLHFLSLAEAWFLAGRSGQAAGRLTRTALLHGTRPRSSSLLWTTSCTTNWTASWWTAAPPRRAKN